MNFIQLQELLLMFDIKTNVSGDEISIDTKYNKYEDYEVLMRNKEKFEYGMMIQERQNIPYFRCEKKFTNINEATKCFFIDMLSSKYKINKLLGTEFRKTLSMDVYKRNFNIEEFKKLMIENKISKDLLVLDKKDIKKQRGFLLVRNDNDEFYKYYIDNDGKICSLYTKLKYSDINLDMYVSIFALNFFEKEVIPKLKEMNIYNEFTEEDIYNFVF